MSEQLTLSVIEAAKLIGMGRAAMYRLVRSGEIPHLRIGRKVLIPRAGLEEWLAEQARRSTR